MKLLKPEEVSQILGVSRSTALRNVPESLRPVAAHPEFSTEAESRMISEQNIPAEKPERAKPKCPEPGQLWTVPQIAHRLQLSQSTIIRMITAGAISALCVRSGKRKKTYRVRSEVLDKWILSKERESTGA